MTRRCRRCGVDREVNESRARRGEDQGLCRDCITVERDLASMPCPLGLASKWGHKKHIQLGDVPCDACREASARDQELYRRRKGIPAMRRAECGTPSGRSRHAKHKEPTCDDCKAAQAEYARAHRQRQREQAA